MLRGIEHAPERTALRFCVAPPDFRFDVVRKDHRGAGEPLRQVHGGKEKIADDQIERPFRDERLDALSERARAVLSDRVRQRIDQMHRGVAVEAQRPFGRLGARNRLHARRDVEHAGDVGRRRAGLREREVGDLVARRQMAHQMPRAELAALVKRQQQIRLQPQYPHGVASALLRGR